MTVSEINAPHGFMTYYRSDITAAMAGWRHSGRPRST
jgi:hypothetical protein